MPSLQRRVDDLEIAMNTNTPPPLTSALAELRATHTPAEVRTLYDEVRAQAAETADAERYADLSAQELVDLYFRISR